MELNKTFEQQVNLVNNVIVPTAMNTLDQDTFPVLDSIVYDIIHKLHRHRREEYLMKLRSETEQEAQKRRKHRNCRRSEVIDNLNCTINNF